MPPKPTQGTPTPADTGTGLAPAGDLFGQYVWVQGADGAYYHGVIEDQDREKGLYRIKVQGSDRTVNKPLKEMLGSNHPMMPQDCHDLTKLVYIHAPAVLHMLGSNHPMMPQDCHDLTKLVY